MRTRHRALSALAMASLVALLLAACSAGDEENPTEAATQEAPPSQDPADATPQERVEAYLDSFDAAAAHGWPDTSYNAEYLSPELAKKPDADDAKNKDSGVTFEGKRGLSQWTTVKEADTSTVVEFCQDTSKQRVIQGGKDVGETEAADVGKFALTRSSPTEAWYISEMEFYPEGTTCADHFAQPED
ncbi:hypothetical protein [Brachybacterium sacelli]|uniref:Lipoprotein n=1 Tax=Brachybacterium sacelli TaxID=173364 RepID=A0ABS4WWV3_9MICO|nr:hypothetical protein [Brachybacterium sacelli]MBP2380680.1 hypothetical protein [Brachybacterium sacelli]